MHLTTIVMCLNSLTDGVVKQKEHVGVFH